MKNSHLYPVTTLPSNRSVQLAMVSKVFYRTDDDNKVETVCKHAEEIVVIDTTEEDFDYGKAEETVKHWTEQVNIAKLGAQSLEMNFAKAQNEGIMEALKCINNNIINLANNHDPDIETSKF